MIIMLNVVAYMSFNLSSADVCFIKEPVNNKFRFCLDVYVYANINILIFNNNFWFYLGVF